MADARRPRIEAAASILMPLWIRAGRTGSAPLCEPPEDRAFPFPMGVQPKDCVTGIPSAPKRSRMAVRTPG
jgi:hypothetical protein